jgi:Cu+-exporting ATPase
MDANEHQQTLGNSHGFAANRAAEKDPVCGMTVDPATAKHQTDFEGQTYSFCSAGCRQKFAAEPRKYLARPEPEASKPAAPPPGQGEVLRT